jgi:trans-aconitate 2-methyltransferase
MNNTSLPWNPDLYQESSSIQYNLGLMAIERLNPIDNEHILDIGCGTGLLAIELSRKIPNGRVTGIETSPYMFETAFANIRSSGAENVNILKMDALGISFNEEYDAVFSNSAIHWIQELETMYRLIYQSLKCNGRIMIQTGIREMNPLIQAFITVLGNERYRPYFSEVRLPWRFLTVDETEAILQGSGFSDIDIFLYPDRQIFKTAKELSGYLESAAMVPLLPHVPEDEKQEFINFFVGTYIEKNNNRLEASSTRVFISAYKK